MGSTKSTKVPKFDPEVMVAEMCHRSFKHFVKRAWGEIDNSKLVWNWHLDAICDHLQAVEEEKIHRIIINIPPGLGKSLLVSVLFPAWVWARNPREQMMYSSYASELAIRDSVKTRTLLKSRWYETYMQKGWTISEDVAGKTRFMTNVGGDRMIVTDGGQNTGYRGNYLIFDDPLKAGDASSDIKRKNVIDFKTLTMTNRYNNAKTFREIVIAQRLHEGDLPGFLLAQTQDSPQGTPGKWQHLNLPAEFDPIRKSRTYLDDGTFFWEDPRQTEGELLFPQHLDKNELYRLKSPQGLGEYGYAGQYQQRPAPAGGGMFKEEWFQYYDEAPECSEYIMSVDAAFKGDDTNDPVAIQVWGRKDANAYLLDTIWKTMGYKDTCRSIHTLKAKWPQIGDIIIEEAANGFAIIEEMQTQIPRVQGVKPIGGKNSRAASVTGFFEAGNVRLPKNASWVRAFIHEFTTFPNGDHDDAVDAAAHGLKRLMISSNLARLEKLAKW